MGLQDRGRAKDFSLLHSVQAGFVTHPASYTTSTLAVFPGVKQQGHEDDHSHPSSAEVKNGEAITPLPHTPSRRSA
jgi:hypothetical protein